MKSLVIALLLVSGSAMAAPLEYDQQIEFISWCEDNKVVSLNDKDETVVKADCSQQALVCKGRKQYFAGRYIFAARCTQPVQQ